MSSSVREIREFTVAAAVVRDPDDRVLLTRRPPGKHMGGLWEFPGGKIQDGEAPQAALVRELHEELGITATVGEPITFSIHEEPGLRILLLFFEVEVTGGRPSGREGQAVCWVEPSQLSNYPTPPADAALVARLATGDHP